MTAEIETGVGVVLAAQLEEDWINRVWADLLRWGRWNFTPAEERAVSRARRA